MPAGGEPATTRERNPPGAPIGRELGRKAIHVATIGAPLLVWVLPRTLAISILGAAVALAAVVEVARWRSRWVRYRFLRGTRRMLRPHERNRPAGATYLAVSYLLAAVLFPRPLAVAAMLYTGLGDAAAALVGRRWGRHRTSWGKSWEGLAAGMLANLGVGLAIPGMPGAVAIVGALTAATLEFLPLPLDDNLRVTVGGGLAGALVWLLVGSGGAA